MGGQAGRRGPGALCRAGAASASGSAPLACFARCARRRRSPCAASEPAALPICLPTLPHPTHLLQGIGAGFVPKNLDVPLLDGVVQVPAGFRSGCCCCGQHALLCWTAWCRCPRAGQPICLPATACFAAAQCARAAAARQRPAPSWLLSHPTSSLTDLPTHPPALRSPTAPRSPPTTPSTRRGAWRWRRA